MANSQLCADSRLCVATYSGQDEHCFVLPAFEVEWDGQSTTIHFEALLYPFLHPKNFSLGTLTPK